LTQASTPPSRYPAILSYPILASLIITSSSFPASQIKINLEVGANNFPHQRPNYILIRSLLIDPGTKALTKSFLNLESTAIYPCSINSPNFYAVKATLFLFINSSTEGTFYLFMAASWKK
jgi:hypothetical protein